MVGEPCPPTTINPNSSLSGTTTQARDACSTRTSSSFTGRLLFVSDARKPRTTLSRTASRTTSFVALLFTSTARTYCTRPEAWHTRSTFTSGSASTSGSTAHARSTRLSGTGPRSYFPNRLNLETRV